MTSPTTPLHIKDELTFSTDGSIGIPCTTRIPTGTTLVKKDDIRIKAVDNGYMLFLHSTYITNDLGTTPEVVAVFNDFYEMCNWLESYYNVKDINE